MGTVLVLGLGNPLLSDDGVGPRAIERLARGYRFPGNVELLDGGTGGLRLAAEVAEAEKLLVLDAVDAGLPPGSVLALEPPWREMKSAKLSPHEISLGDILALARTAGGPQEVVVLGVQPERLGAGVELSPAVAAALERLEAEAVAQLARWDAGPEGRVDA
jgi:hydrogenase maturation protease